MKLPVARWLPSYRSDWLRADVVAGLTAAAMVIPKAMAIAAIAGLAVEIGLYTALAAMLVYPLLGADHARSDRWTGLPMVIFRSSPYTAPRPAANPTDVSEKPYCQTCRTHPRFH